MYIVYCAVVSKWYILPDGTFNNVPTGNSWLDGDCTVGNDCDSDGFDVVVVYIDGLDVVVVDTDGFDVIVVDTDGFYVVVVAAAVVGFIVGNCCDEIVGNIDGFDVGAGTLCCVGRCVGAGAGAVLRPSG